MIRARVHSIHWVWVPMGGGGSKSKLGWFVTSHKWRPYWQVAPSVGRPLPGVAERPPAQAGWAVRPQLRVAL